MLEFILTFLGTVFLCLISLLVVNLAKLSENVSSLNRKLELLMKHSGMNVHEVAIREAQVLMKGGKKIEAIKCYRDLTGASLVEAKSAVERMQEGAGPA